MILEILAAGIISVAFGFIFNIRGKNLIFTGLNGALGLGIFSLSLHLGTASYVAMFFATMVMAISAEIAARLRKAPASVFLVAALTPIVPGSGIFHFVLYLLQGAREAATATGVLTVMETAGIAIGVIIVTSFIKMIPRRKY